uniref:Ig-like domain-containing protein n=1 Tax=Fundulus heteroclitus TaxID=8078 RepID=A0A3Q2P8D1_FUNHE
MFFYLHCVTDMFVGYSGCKDYPTIQTKTIYVGDPVKLTCSRRDAGEFLWMRTSSGDSPDIFGKHENMYSHVKVSLEPGIVVLQITKARINDSGLYFCQRVYKGNKSILTLTYLSVEESATITDPTSAPPHLRDSLTLYCSGLRDSQNKSCPGDESLLCFRAESIQTLPGLNYTDNEEDRLKFDSEGCVYSYFKNYSMSGTSDDVTYYCAVAACGQILFGNGAKLHIKGSKALRTNSVASKSRQVDVYTVVIFTIMNTDNGGKKEANTETTKIYAKVAFLH